MRGLEDAVRGVETEGLVWGSSKLIPVGFGVQKLQINFLASGGRILSFHSSILSDSSCRI
jgi:elongation factor 1-beta